MKSQRMNPVIPIIPEVSIASILDDRMFPMHSEEAPKPGTEIDVASVCNGCTSGMCCISEDPIEMWPKDVKRLATFLGLSEEQFLQKYGAPLEGHFELDLNVDARIARTRRNPPQALLERKAKTALSECVFLGWRINANGHISRGCTVHTARPDACREYTYAGCSTIAKPTWELATATSAVIEAVEAGINVEHAKHRVRPIRTLVSSKGPALTEELIEYLKGVAHEARIVRDSGANAVSNKGPASYAYPFALRTSLGPVFNNGPIQVSPVSPSLTRRAEIVLAKGVNAYANIANYYSRASDLNYSMNAVSELDTGLYDVSLFFRSGQRSADLWNRLGLQKLMRQGQLEVTRQVRRNLDIPEYRQLLIRAEDVASEGWLRLGILGNVKYDGLRPLSEFCENLRRMYSVHPQSLRSEASFERAYYRALSVRLAAHFEPSIDPHQVLGHYLTLLERTPVTEEHFIDYYNLVTHIGYGICYYGMTSIKGYEKLAERTNVLAWKLYAWMKTNRLRYDDPELIGEFVDATHLLLGFPIDGRVTEVVDTIIEKQHSSGAWMVDHVATGCDWVPGQRELYTAQGEYTYSVEHGTMVAVDALRAFLDSDYGWINRRRNALVLP